jgi:hypothetical protein
MSATLGQRLKEQRNSVLDLWGAGIPANKIPERLASSGITVSHCAVRGIVKRARKSLDDRAHTRQAACIPPILHVTIAREAEARGTDVNGLVAAVLTSAFESEWFLKVVLNEDTSP